MHDNYFRVVIVIVILPVPIILRHASSAHAAAHAACARAHAVCVQVASAGAACARAAAVSDGHRAQAAAGAAANRVALEACVKARNAGREIEREGRDILMEAAKHSPELAIALETWKEIKFEFDTVDKLDVH